MVKSYYIQDYPGNCRDNTVTRTIASDFIRPPYQEQSKQGREKRLENSNVGTKKDLWKLLTFFHAV